ncbi:uncharacterized protein TM35_000161470 [Trypanosoma theileri]|uniref:Uncharacterized protein n=1 Tax=Trypanosoma theileri TaxID=67003 RepID=A0A1X0NWD0_9TRYP|nr:uncharacterized protein TM35_000161470 [Trypanosoma theileri]ORC88509.1 hypothetical protein TM35_000161470 [Trypanosoma theileri]
MRGGFRRGRFDKVPQPGTIGSYTEAFYPPRVYYYYTHPPTSTTTSAATVIVPSIDDGVGDSRGREVPIQGVSSAMGRRVPPILQDFIGCFVDANQCAADSRAFTILESGKEPLNILHYPYLLSANSGRENVDTSGKLPQSNEVGNRSLRIWEDALGLPNELKFYSSVNVSSEMTSSTMERLRIRPVKQKRIVKPVRRGAKVVILNPAAGESIQETRKTKRNLGDDDDDVGGVKKQPKGEDDDPEGEGEGEYDKDDDEASISFQVDDDDDGGDLDGPEGSGGEDDFF